MVRVWIMLKANNQGEEKCRHSFCVTLLWKLPGSYNIATNAVVTLDKVPNHITPYFGSIKK